MEKKKVFSAKKWAEYMIKIGVSSSDFRRSLKWVYDCEGKTPEEMKKMNYMSNENWLIEIGVEE